MGLLVLLYFVLSIAVSGQMIYHGATWPGVALLIGSIVGFIAGSGARGGIYKGRRSSLTIGIILLFAGAGLVFYSDAIITAFGIELAGDTWVGIGAVVGWFAAKPEDAGLGLQASSGAPNA